MIHYRLSTLLIVFVAFIFAVVVPVIADEHEEDPLEDEPVFVVCGEVEIVGDDVVVKGVVILLAAGDDTSLFVEENIVAVYGTLSEDETSLDPEQTVALDDISECDGLEEDEDVVFCDVSTGDEGILDEPVEGEDDENDEACETPHPIAVILADEFEVDLATIHEWHEDGYGFGEIARILLIVDVLDDEDSDADTIIEMREDGAGWGEIIRDLELNPRDLAPGRVISGRYNPQDIDELPAVQAIAPPGHAQNNGNANGNANNNGGNANGNANGNGRGRGRG